jgi:hypothetical protein
LATARRARRDDLHRAVDAGDPVEVRPIVIVDVGVADEEVTDHDRGPDHLREVLWCVGEVEQGKKTRCYDQGEDLRREREIEFQRCERLVAEM